MSLSIRSAAREPRVSISIEIVLEGTLAPARPGLKSPGVGSLGEIASLSRLPRASGIATRNSLLRGEKPESDSQYKRSGRRRTCFCKFDVVLHSSRQSRQQADNELATESTRICAPIRSSELCSVVSACGSGGYVPPLPTPLQVEHHIQTPPVKPFL